MMEAQDLAQLASSDISFIDDLYRQYQENPDEVDPSWQYFFRGLEFAKNLSADEGSSTGDFDKAMLFKEFNVFRLIQSFRARGHLISDTNPIRERINRHARISLEDYDLSDDDLKKQFHCGEFVGLGYATLGSILKLMKKMYCNKIGIEYMHSNDTEVRRWVRKEFESGIVNLNYTLEKKKRIMQKLNEANVFENFLQTKFTGQKRFSLEGGECTIPALDAIINKGSELGAKTIVIGMAHRGRLNVLANTIGKTYEFIFSEFQGQKVDLGQLHQGMGDVKYHMGYGSTIKSTSGKDIYLKLLPNPSHLEAVAPVVQGFCRSQIDVAFGGDESKAIPIIIHGDAAVAGQGIVYEALQMSQLDGYRNGGTIHFIINNQIGFTTDFQDGRSSHYCVSVARTLDAPILHVNGDCPEEVVYACELAVQYRQKFHHDVFIDMVCYRKHGHNEGDEPKYTQPHLYGLISKQKNPRELYMEKLSASGEFERALVKKMQDDFKQKLSDRFNDVKQKELPNRKKGPYKEWDNLRLSTTEDFEKSPETGVSEKMLESIMDAITSVPGDFKLLRKAQKIMERRRSCYNSDQLDWATTEMLAYGTLLAQKQNIRFSGQDVIRGTFSHRHVKFFDEFTNKAYCGLENIQEDQGKFDIYNSLLSEYAVLGFEYGYSQGTPRSLNVWEAQFGDFVNGAQIILDQFIVSGETKWCKMSGLVLLLPHGYEGQGPEHSSARPERFLQTAAQDNIVIINTTTPDNFFHALRRQQVWEFRKPLVVFTPKSLLRDPLCICTKEQLMKGHFRELIDDEVTVADKVKKVVFCSGKIYFTLLKERDEKKLKSIAIVRVEQLYPMAKKQLHALLKKYKKAKKVWVQEEPLNMGAWGYLMRMEEFRTEFSPVGRKESSSPATGSGATHQYEQDEIIAKALSTKD
ncbi:2-oxoglutarate dehydrogenase E1 component [Bacteriovoracaceae bacterium]|nr:2-oxoglutarate dehydrogenase E1 component [Bacteriovoracaceae bacterium]